MLGQVGAHPARTEPKHPCKAVRPPSGEARSWKYRDVCGCHEPFMLPVRSKFCLSCILYVEDSEHNTNNYWF